MLPANLSSWAMLASHAAGLSAQLEQAPPLKQQHHDLAASDHAASRSHSSAPMARHAADVDASTTKQTLQRSRCLQTPLPQRPQPAKPHCAPFAPWCGLDHTRAQHEICRLAGPSPSAPRASHAAVDAALGHSGSLRLNWEHIMDQDLHATPVLDPLEAPAMQPLGNGAPEHLDSDYPSGSLRIPSLEQGPHRAPRQQHSGDPVGPQALTRPGGGAILPPTPSSGLPTGQGQLDGSAQHVGASSRAPVSWGYAGQEQAVALEGGENTQQHASTNRLPAAQAHTAEQPSRTSPLDAQSSYPPRGLAMRSPQAPPASWPKIMPSWNAAVSVDPFQQVLDSSSSEPQPQQKGQSL